MHHMASSDPNRKFKSAVRLGSLFQQSTILHGTGTYRSIECGDQRLGELGLGELASSQALAQVGAQDSQLGDATDDADLFSKGGERAQKTAERPNSNRWLRGTGQTTRCLLVHELRREKEGVDFH